MIIYKTINLINSKFYIGKDSKNNPEYLGSGLNLQRAIKKYGKENFEKIILEYCETNEQLCVREKHWIKETKAQELGYNIADGGHGGSTYTEETRKRISQERKGRKLPKEVIEKMLATKKSRIYPKRVITEEYRQKLHKITKKLWETTEYREKVIKGLKNCNRVYSKEFLERQTTSNGPHTEVTKNKLKLAHKNKTPEQKLNIYKQFILTKYCRVVTLEECDNKLKQYRGELKKISKIKPPMSEATKKKISLARLGKPSWNKGLKMSEATKKKISITKTGLKPKPRTEEHRRKLSQTMKKYKRTSEHQAAINASLKGKKAWNKGLKVNLELKNKEGGYQN